MPSELYVQVPATYGDPFYAGPGSPLLALEQFGVPAVGHLLNLHLQLVLYSKRWRLDGVVSLGVVQKYVRPLSRRTARRDAQRLVQAGFLESRDDDHFFVPAAVEWPVVRTGTREAIPERVRRLVFERDNWRCVKCWATEDLTLDHITPWSLNGPDDARNLQTLCGSCNSSKGARV